MLLIHIRITLLIILNKNKHLFPDDNITTDQDNKNKDMGFNNMAHTSNVTSIDVNPDDTPHKTLQSYVNFLEKTLSELEKQTLYISILKDTNELQLNKLINRIHNSSITKKTDVNGITAYTTLENVAIICTSISNIILFIYGLKKLVIKYFFQ